jgi:hypothetical protein
MLSFIRSLFSDIAFNQLGGITLFGTMNKTKSVTTKPAPTTPPPVLEEDEESNDLAITNHQTDLLPQEIIRSEVNFLNYPFFALSRTDAQKRMKIEYHTTVKREDKRLDVYWKVSANPEYGYPRPFDRQVHKAIEYIISNLPRPIHNPVPIGSLYRISQLLGLRDSGQVYRDIKTALQRIVATTIESKGTFSDKGRKRWREATFHLYDKVVFTGEDLPDGEVADTNYLFVDSWYLDNINARYVRPLDYTYYRSLHSPIASRLYELLGVKFYGMGNLPSIRYRYSTLCQLLPVKQQRYASDAKRNLHTAHQELINTGFLNNVEWDGIDAEKHDWYVSYYPGTRAKEEIQRFSKQVALPPPEDSVEATSVAAPVAPQPTASDANDVVNALQKFGITKKQAQKLAKEHPEEDILKQLDIVKWLVAQKSPLVAKNPQGYLVKAIEEDYPPPPQYQRKGQQDKEAAERQQREEREQQERLAAREQAREQLQQEHPPQPITGTNHTTASAWAKTLETLQQQVHKGTFLTTLKDTLLLRMEGNTAYVMVANSWAYTVIKKRLDGLIAGALEQVLGYPVDVEFVVAPETT